MTNFAVLFFFKEAEFDWDSKLQGNCSTLQSTKLNRRLMRAILRQRLKTKPNAHESLSMALKECLVKHY